jgi:hypothetical protein
MMTNDIVILTMMMIVIIVKGPSEF